MSCSGNCEGCACGATIDVSDYIGKTMLAGITLCDNAGNAASHHAVWGTVLGTNAAGWLELELHGKESNPLDGSRMLAFPPDAASIEPGDDSEYHLRDTGEIVAAPDFVARLRVA